MHESLDGVYAVVVSEHAVYGCAAIALAAVEEVALGPGDQAVKELSDFHVLSNVTRCVAEFILQKRICLGFLY